ncbi:glycoside hydrolase family 3 N-terminal domain-containing protein, partial [Colibacter massiliensis]
LVSHLTYAGLDGDRPASLSYAVMTNLLRKELQYKGLIITDDMEMGAVAELYSFEELGVRSFLAGADIIMVCHDYEHERKVYNGILQALHRGRIGRERLDASVKRIVKTKLLNLR